MDEAPALGGLTDCPLPQVREFAVLPLDTGVTIPPNNLRLLHIVVPSFHGGMLDDAVTAEVVARVVAGRHVRAPGGWSIAESVLEAGASAWQVPALTPSLNLAWDGGPDPADCRAIRRHLEARMATGP